jgi:hypothetical protein
MPLGSKLYVIVTLMTFHYAMRCNWRNRGSKVDYRIRDQGCDEKNPKGFKMTSQLWCMGCSIDSEGFEFISKKKKPICMGAPKWGFILERVN